MDKQVKNINLNKIPLFMIAALLSLVNLIPFIFLQKVEAIQTTTPIITITDLQLGNTYRLSDLLGGVKLNVINDSGGTANIKIEMLGPYWTSDPDNGYQIIPSTTWVQADPVTLNGVANGTTSQVDLVVTLPNNAQYADKKYYVGVWMHEYNFSGNYGAGVIAKLYFNTKPATSITATNNPPDINVGVNIFATQKVVFLPNKKVNVNATVTDDNNVASVKLYYRKVGDTAYNSIAFGPAIPNGATSYTGSAVIPQDSVTSAGFEYYLEAFDGTLYNYWGSASSPQKGEVGQTTITTYGADNSIIFYDGDAQKVVGKLTIPAKALSRQTTIGVKQLDVNTVPIAGDLSLSSIPVLALEFTPSGIQFNKPVTLTMNYSDTDADGVVDGTNIQASDLAMFYHDGFDWRYLGNKVNTTDKTVMAPTNHFTIFALFPAKALAASDYRPKEKIITPNGDSINDIANFSGLTEEINIFDITGRKIRTIDANTGSWDGKDKDGNIVANGVYIYQFKFEGKLISGTIAVAK
jgi:gliding motility-associated-like protein